MLSWEECDPFYRKIVEVLIILSQTTIQLSHFSVKEFLTSARLAESSDIIPRRYYVSMTPAHTLAAQACLGTLLHLDNENVVTSVGLEKLPLAKYATEHWVDHVRFEDVAEKLEDGMKLDSRPGCPSLETKPTSWKTVST
jgi:hypothetical protein